MDSIKKKVYETGQTVSDFVQQVDRYADNSDCNGCSQIIKKDIKNPIKSAFIHLISVSIYLLSSDSYRIKQLSITQSVFKLFTGFIKAALTL